MRICKTHCFFILCVCFFCSLSFRSIIIFFLFFHIKMHTFYPCIFLLSLSLMLIYDLRIRKALLSFVSVTWRSLSVLYFCYSLFIKLTWIQNTWLSIWKISDIIRILKQSSRNWNILFIILCSNIRNTSMRFYLLLISMNCCRRWRWWINYF